MLKMPTNAGYYIEYQSGKTTKNGKPIMASYESTSYEKVAQKKEELEKQGIKVSEIMDCIF